VAEQQSGSLLRQARRQAGLTQAQLAQRAGITQSVVSAYESAARQPSLPMLNRLVAATGLEVDVRVRRPTSSIDTTPSG
jgi:transcriptional regulator with XRE-family HTH domain